MSAVFTGCLNESKTSCPANRSVAMIMNGKNYTPRPTRDRGMSCPANYTKPISSLSSEVSCPANLQKETVKPEAHSSCPPGAIGAEKLLGYIDVMETITDNHATYKTDPVTGQRTSQAKGIRIGEIEKPIKPTKEQLAYYKRKKAEEDAIIRQMKRDIKEYNKEPPL